MDMANPNYKPRIPEWVDIGEHISIAVSGPYESEGRADRSG